MTVQRLSTIEKDLTKILTNNWQPGAARMILVHHTAAWAGKHGSWTQWIKHLTKVTENGEQWLFRVFKAGQLLLQVAEKHFNTVPNFTDAADIERVLTSFEKAKVETMYLASLLAKRTNNDDWLYDAAMGRVLQPELRELLKNGVPEPAADDSEESEEGEGSESEARPAPAAPVRATVSMEALRKACEELGVDAMTGYALLKRLGIPVLKEA